MIRFKEAFIRVLTELEADETREVEMAKKHKPTIANWLEAPRIVAKYWGIDCTAAVIGDCEDLPYLDLTSGQVTVDSPDGKRLTEIGFHLEYDYWTANA